MNCQQFDGIVIDLARGAMMDAHARESSLAHADSCAGCQARLAGERALTGGLRALARESAQTESAPAHIEASLRAAFRQHLAATMTTAIVEQSATVDIQAQAANTNASAPLSISSFAGKRDARAQSWMNQRALAAAAAIVLMATAGLIALSAWRQSSPSGVEQALNQPTATSTEVRSDETTSRLESSNKQTIAPMNLPPSLGENERNPHDDRPAHTGRAASSPSRFGARYTNASFRSDRQRGGRAALNTPANTTATADADEEVATDFFPVSGASGLMPMDGGHMVRVELPRSTLASFGLPVNSERAGERVKADVLVGSDGMARAIRFVR
jgi:hypothetical protein